MECEACDTNIAVWSVCVDEKRTTMFGVCDDCFDEHWVCWTAFARKMCRSCNSPNEPGVNHCSYACKVSDCGFDTEPTCWYCDGPTESGENYCSYACKVNDCGCKADPTCCGDDE